MPEPDRTAAPAAARRAARRAPRAAVACCLAALGVAGLAGCYARASAAPLISLSTAYVPQPSVPGRTVAYLIIRNNGARDRLISARTSAGGRVTFQADGPGGTSSVARTVRWIPVPADSTVRLIPSGLHLLITGAGQLRGGKDITLTLTFAHAGAVSVTAQVTNPQTGGSSYFLN
ncbi:MAG TPA: copper chaperone PCu(A)C [Streptosporangiaceae bacterium]|nr:copper chaperone PCu(A)C [Streptosporangiaceae bacterium]